ncbi:ABC transporter substrate-binding protein [Rapidithrix thailandica]|uniref:ABC transporter substrate-binding protein n=1 Tax=Rapidithrix thailandica TaxID=413964 RepID=A0AAW9RYB7_9BACT
MLKIKTLFILLMACAVYACGPKQSAETVENQKQNDEKVLHKLVTIGGTVSEIVCALGKQEWIVATDRTSTYPAALQQLPSVGYRTNIKAEGVVSTGANMVLADETSMNPDLKTQLEDAGITVKVFKNELTLDGTKKLIHEVAESLNLKEEGTNLVQSLEADWQKVTEKLQGVATKPSVIFVYARGAGTMNIAGKGTFADEMIRLAGGTPAIRDIEQFKPLTSEALIEANPDFLLFFDSGLESLGGVEGALKITGVAETTAGKQKNIIAMEGQYLSGFGPRVVQAVLELSELIHPQAQ